MKLPSLDGSPWHERPSTLAFAAGLSALCLTAQKAWPDVATAHASASTGSTLTLGFLAAGLAIHQARRKEARAGAASRDLAGLHGALCVLRSTLLNSYAGSEDDRRKVLRLTVHRFDGETLEQLVDYVGGAGGGAGRKHSAKSGVIGDSARRNAFVVETRSAKDHEDFVRELVRVHRFTETEARALTSDRWAWAAHPLPDAEGKVLGVVYADSCNVGFFTGARRKRFVEGCHGLADYLQSSDTRDSP